MDLNVMTEFTLATCIVCGRPTIGGRGHFVECKPAPPESALERIVIAIALEEEEEEE